MIRWLQGILILTAAGSLGAGCNNVSCGRGTKQVQDALGNVACVPVDSIGPEPCKDDADAGTAIIGGICVGNTVCGPGTTAVKRMDGSNTYYCQGTGVVSATCTGTPTAGSICLEGTIRHFADNSPLGANEKVHIAVYDPLSFLATPRGAPQAMTEMDLTGPHYYIASFPFPADNLIALAVSDAAGAPMMLAVGGSGLQGSPGQNYKLDGYAVLASQVTQWQSTAAAGVDYAGKGAYVGCFFSDASRALALDFTLYEMAPVSGVKLQALTPNPTPIPNAQYLNATRNSDPALSATGPIGCAITDVKGLSAFSGAGGTVAKWEQHPGGSAPGVVFVDRFHPGM